MKQRKKKEKTTHCQEVNEEKLRYNTYVATERNFFNKYNQCVKGSNRKGGQNEKSDG